MAQVDGLPPYRKLEAAIPDPKRQFILPVPLSEVGLMISHLFGITTTQPSAESDSHATSQIGIVTHPLSVLFAPNGVCLLAAGTVWEL